MGNLVIGLLSFATMVLLILIGVVAICCLYVGVESDRKSKVLVDNYIGEKSNV